MSKRAEMRRAEKEKQKSTARLNLTVEEINAMASRQFEELRKEVMEDDIGAALVLLLTIPLDILRKDYWPKSYKKKLPELADKIIERLNQWENEELDLEALREDLWEDAGLRFDRDYVDR